MEVRDGGEVEVHDEGGGSQRGLQPNNDNTAQQHGYGHDDNTAQ